MVIKFNTKNEESKHGYKSYLDKGIINQLQVDPGQRVYLNLAP